MALVSHEVILALRDLLAERFTADELRDLALALGIDYDDIPGKTRINKAGELPAYLNRRGQIGKLLEAGPKVRPDIDWATALGQVAQEVDETLTNRVPGEELAEVARIMAGLPDFAAQIDRKTMMEVAGVDQFTAAIDLSGAERPVSLRVLTHLNARAVPGQTPTPLGKLLRYIQSLPDVTSDDNNRIQALIDEYRL